MYRQQPWAVVLAGGKGDRVRRFLSQLCGGRGLKQFCAVVGSRSMLQHTVNRIERIIPRSRILVIVSAGDRVEVSRQLGDWPPENIIYQPANRETAPGILLPLPHLSNRDPAATVAFFPSDHFVLDEAPFMSHAVKALKEAERFPRQLIFLGMTPDRVESGYGWIQPADDRGVSRSVPVAKFYEKPSTARGRALFAQGALWNTFVFAAKAAAVWAIIRDAGPDLYNAFSNIQTMLRSAHAPLYLDHAYRTMRSVNFSSEICAPWASRLRVVPVPDIGWSDWGCAERICASLMALGKLDDLLDRLAKAEADAPTLNLVKRFRDDAQANRRQSATRNGRKAQRSLTL